MRHENIPAEGAVENNGFSIFVDWKRKLLSRHQLTRPDRRDLYQYRLTEEEFNDLKCLMHKWLNKLSRFDLSRISRLKEFSGLFVLYAAEWWRRRFDGSHWSWDPILRAVGADPKEWTALQRSECVRLGLEDWYLALRENGGLRFLGNIAVQGGLPLKLLAEARGKIGQLLSQVLKQAGNSSIMQADLLAWVESLQGSLPKSYRQAAVYTLLADVAWNVLRLKEEAGLTSSADAIPELDRQISGWRERFPLPMEDAHARGLIEQLVRDAASVRIERRVICLPVERQLVPNENGEWSLQSNVTLPDIIIKDQLAKLFNIKVENLPRTGELTLTAGSYRRGTTIRHMAGHDSYRIERKPWAYSEATSTCEHVLHLCAPDGRLWSGVAPKGEMLDEELPWIFSAEEYTCRFLRQGGGSVAVLEALVALPAGWTICPTEESEAFVCGHLNSFGRELFRIKGVVEAHDGSGISCRIRTGQAGLEENSYEWRGQRVWLDFQSPAMAFKGIPDLYQIKQDGTIQKVTGDIGWNVTGAASATGMKPIGLGAIRYPDNGVVEQRARIVVLPEDAALSLASCDAASGDVRFDNWGATVVRVLTDGIQHESRKEGDTLVLSLNVPQGKRTPERVEIELFWPQSTIPARLSLPFPGRGARVFDASGVELRSGRLLAADQLAGVRALMLDGGNNARMTLEIKSSRGGHARVHKLTALPGALSVEMRLQDYAVDIQHMLSIDDKPDGHVQIELRVGGSDLYQLDVARYAAKLDKNDSKKIQLDNDVVAELTSEEISTLPVMALRLERPGDEAILLNPCTSEGVPTGSWTFMPEEREPGCWLIYPGPEAQLRFRPTLLTVQGDVQSGSLLSNAIGIHDQKEREDALDAMIEKLTEDYQSPCWIEVEQLAGQVGHLPLATLDIWRRFAHSPKGMAALAIRFGTLPGGFLDRFAQELPFAWEAVPFVAWKQAMERLQSQCKYLFTEDADACIFQTHLNSRIKDMTAAHGALDYLLGIVSADHIPEARQQLPPLRHVGANHNLFDGESSQLMRLLRQHGEDDWPSVLSPTLVQTREQPEVANFLYPKDDLGYRAGIVNMPLLLAAQVWMGQIDQWFANPDAIHDLRAYRAFDPEWFDDAYNLTIVRCLAASSADS
ncbi:MAG: STY4851/ECs_5259 family protein [Azoarcus sp.]|jgi:hypothetical protein|nr:STY4851/ECs_5259 family protein [Azoarcus sp.]